MNDASPNAREVERLNNVYQAYHGSQELQAQWSHDNPGNRAIYQERQRIMARLIQAHHFFPLGDRSVLEIGCAAGEVLMSLPRLGAQLPNLHGVDLFSQRIAIAQQRYPGVDFQVGNAEALSFPDAQFDLVLLFTVFSSILSPGMARNVALEASRVLRPGGAIVWYDFRYSNPRNPNVRGMNKRAIRTLFPGFDLDLRTITLLPPLARRLGRAIPVLYPLLGRMPLLRTHYMGLLSKRTAR
jgi:SAM-dependent methyltransferase